RDDKRNDRPGRFQYDRAMKLFGRGEFFALAIFNGEEKYGDNYRYRERNAHQDQIEIEPVDLRGKGRGLFGENWYPRIIFHIKNQHRRAFSSFDGPAFYTCSRLLLFLRQKTINIVPIIKSVATPPRRITLSIARPYLPDAGS